MWRCSHFCQGESCNFSELPFISSITLLTRPNQLLHFASDFSDQKSVVIVHIMLSKVIDERPLSFTEPPCPHRLYNKCPFRKPCNQLHATRCFRWRHAPAPPTQSRGCCMHAFSSVQDAQLCHYSQNASGNPHAKGGVPLKGTKRHFRNNGYFPNGTLN